MNKVQTLFTEFQKKSDEITVLEQQLTVLERQLNRLKNEQKELQTKLKDALKDNASWSFSLNREPS